MYFQKFAKLKSEPPKNGDNSTRPTLNRRRVSVRISRYFRSVLVKKHFLETPKSSPYPYRVSGRRAQMKTKVSMDCKDYFLETCGSLLSLEMTPYSPDFYPSGPFSSDFCSSELFTVFDATVLKATPRAYLYLIFLDVDAHVTRRRRIRFSVSAHRYRRGTDTTSAHTKNPVRTAKNTYTWNVIRPL